MLSVSSLALIRQFVNESAARRRHSTVARAAGTLSHQCCGRRGIDEGMDGHGMAGGRIRKTRLGLMVNAKMLQERRESLPFDFSRLLGRSPGGQGELGWPREGD